MYYFTTYSVHKPFMLPSYHFQTDLHCRTITENVALSSLNDIRLQAPKGSDGDCSRDIFFLAELPDHSFLHKHHLVKTQVGRSSLSISQPQKPRCCRGTLSECNIPTSRRFVSKNHTITPPAPQGPISMSTTDEFLSVHKIPFCTFPHLPHYQLMLAAIPGWKLRSSPHRSNSIGKYTKTESEDSIIPPKSRDSWSRTVTKTIR